MRYKEIYCTMPSNSKYEAKLEDSGDVFSIIQRIKVILGTSPGDVMGYPSFGVDLSGYIFDYSIPLDEIKKTLKDVFNSMISPAYGNRYNIDVDVNYGKNVNDAYDYAIIDILINEKKVLGIIVG